MKKLLATVALALAALVGQADVMINEIMADNGGKHPNAAGEAMDWLELYNPGATPLDLTGWRITDTVEDKWSKWKEIPAGTTVPAQGYLILWGHNKDFPTPEDAKGFCGITNGEVHVKLGLSSGGETIVLAASEADYDAKAFVDQVTFGAQFADISYGRDPNDTAKWLFFTNATPGAANGTDGLAKYPPDEEQGAPHLQEENTELEESLLDLGLSIVVIDTIDQEEPAYEIANPPPGCWGAGIKNATKVPGRLRIKTTAGVAYDSGEYVKKSSGMTLKIRGNTSARATKKPYKIKLQKATDLLLRDDDEKYADTEWVLLASASSLNNVIGFSINDLLKLQWTPSYQYVNLVVNGTYRGVYLLCEGMNRNPRCRIDVADDGYLFELDAYWWNEDVYFKTPFCRPTVGYTFKYPDSDDITQEQVNLISNVMTHVEDAIDEGNYESCIDVNSFAAWLLGHDILGTSDAGGSNIYFTKYDASREAKVRMANLWDFDTICRCSNDWSAVHYGIHAHFSRLCTSKNLAFNDQYRKKWLQLRHGLCRAIADILDGMESSGLAGALEKSWSQETSALGRTYGSFASHRQSMEAWFSERVEWINAHIDKMPHNPDPSVTVTEIMADNGGSLLTADGKAEDWIELYNPGATDADISGWRLCDGTTKKWSKWEELPVGTIVPAGGHLIVWADDFTGWTNGEVHVNLGFSSKGEEVALAIAEGEIVSSFAFGAQHPDVSFGRDPFNPEKLVYFKTPTPGAENGNDGIENGACFNIRINELMAENGGKFPNAAGEAMDWLELSNAGETDVDVSGWGFQDDPTKEWSKWKTLPAGAVVPAGGYLLVWGDNKDFNSFTGITNGEVHVNMGLSKKGEGLHLALTNGVGTVVRIDGFDFPKQAPDVSWGRTASDPDKFLYFTEPTPAAANGDEGREALMFTIDFDANGGSAVASETNEYDSVIGAPESLRTGYTFAGWYESGAAEPFVFGKMPARDVSLTAHWTPNAYTVTYEPNGGEGAPAVSNATYDVEFAVGACGFAKTGYAFTGWTTNLEVAAEFAPSAAVSNLTVSANGNVTMFATWEANEYALVYSPDEGAGKPVSTNLAYDAEHVVLGCAFAREGHSFSCWTNAEGVAYGPGDVISNLTAEAGATVVWTAAWTANVYTVSFDSNGGSAIDPIAADYGSGIAAPEAPARTGYTFAGWYESGAAEPFVFGKMPARDVSLTAHWTPNAYTVDFNPGQGGEGSMADQPMVYDEAEALYSNVFFRTGYTFLGWTDDDRELEELYNDGVVVSNLTDEVDGEFDLYAVWAANEYAVRFDANGGTGTMADQLFLYDTAQPLASNAFEKANHVFAGWTVAGGTVERSETAEGRDSTVYADGEVVSNLTTEADCVVTLSARWKLNGWSIVVGNRVTIETGMIGYKPNELPKGLTYNKTSGKITGSAKEVGEFVVSFAVDGAEPLQRVIAVHAEKVSIGCDGLASGPLPAGVVGASEGIAVRTDTETGVKSVTVKKLPAGMKYDAKSGVITGAPTTAGDYQVVLSVTSKSGAKKTDTIPVSVAAMPETASGEFRGFVSIGEDNFGTVALSATGAGKLTAKVVTAKGSYSFAKTGWGSVKDGVYETQLETKKGDVLTLRLDSTAAWDADQLSGTFVTAAVAATKKAAAVPPRKYSVSAQRNAFGKTWYFAATGDATSGWTLTFVKDAKAAVLTVTLKADGTTSVVGKLPNRKGEDGKDVSVKVSSSGYANVGGLREGAVLADFVSVMTVGGKKKVLAIETNLWFDRKNDHASGIGDAKFVE